MKKSALVLFALLMGIQSAFADTSRFIDRWYDALRIVNRATFNTLLADEATIELKQLGVEQDKEEFVESLDYWEDIAGDLFISPNIVSSSDQLIEVDVCYRFPSNSHTNRETFHIKGGLIVRQIQEKLREGC